MSRLVPLFADKVADWTATVQLEGASFRLRFWWSDQLAAWLSSLSTIEGVDLSINKQVSLDWPLFQSLVSDAGYAGQLWCVDTNGGGILDRDNFGSDVQVVYLTAAEVAEAEAANVTPSQYFISTS